MTGVPQRLPLHPKHPERVCWGCDEYCAAAELRCGNCSDRAQHPAEIFGEDWLCHGLDAGLAGWPTAIGRSEPGRGAGSAGSG